MKNDNKNFGFTLIELLVVVSIIGLLSSVILASLSSAKDKANYAKAKAEMNSLKTAMISYKLDKGELPPLGDNCSGCSNPPDSTWTQVIDALINGKYLSSRIDKDPWGNYYGYDDNDCNSGASAVAVSPLFTAGPDKLNTTSDDYKITITNGCNL